MENFSELLDKKWVHDFAFSVAIIGHMNAVNVKMQQKKYMLLKKYLMHFSMQQTHNEHIDKYKY